MPYVSPRRISLIREVLQYVYVGWVGMPYR